MSKLQGRAKTPVPYSGAGVPARVWNGTEDVLPTEREGKFVVAKRLAVQFFLILNHPRQRFGFFDPMLHMLRTRNNLYVMMGGIDLHQFGVQMFGIPLRQFQDGIYASLFKQFGVLPANAFYAEKIGLIHPSQKVVMPNARLGFQLFAAFGCSGFLQEPFHALDTRSLQLFAVSCSDAFDFVDVSHGFLGKISI